MPALRFQSSTLLLPNSYSCSSRSLSCSFKRTINATIHVPKHRLSSHSHPNKKCLLDQEFKRRDTTVFTNTIPTKHSGLVSSQNRRETRDTYSSDIIISKIYAILEAVNERIEMHTNICEQRDNWNSLLFNSINMIILAATTMVAFEHSAQGKELLQVSSSLLFFAATGMLTLVNKVQPSQLAEEQRKARCLFKHLRGEIETLLISDEFVLIQKDVENLMEKVLVLDRAYPLPLLGAMLDKFPKKLKPSCWWPKNNYQFQRKTQNDNVEENNGWSEDLEMEMREIVEVVRKKDIEDYERLGNIALKLNKVLAISGPVLTGVAATGSAFSGLFPAGAMVAAVAGSMAAIVNTVEHGGQVGMVFEMYRNCAGFFKYVEGKIESTLEESEMEKRENGELFEMKIALKLGRSLSELRDLAMDSASSRIDGNTIDEFASKLF